MTEKDFFDWFLPRAEKFAAIGIMHPNSEWGKMLKISIMANAERIEELEAQIRALHAEVQALQSEKLLNTPPEPKPKKTRAKKST